MSVVYMIIGFISGIVAGVILCNGRDFIHGEGWPTVSAGGAAGFAVCAGLCFIASAIAYGAEGRELRERKKDHQ